MKPLSASIFSVAAILSATACAEYGSRSRGPEPGFIDGYYDDFYGPFDAGYWGEDGVFMYRGRDNQFHRDEGRHVRREGGNGFHSVHMRDGRGMNPR